jgi:glycerophosphoryl diester phosphodiesterase
MGRAGPLRPPADPGAAGPGRPAPLVLAHRGDHRNATENSLAAFRAAAALPGCDGVELDVMAAGDGVAVVHHDPTLRRVHGIATRVDRMTARALAAAGVPSLAGALAAVGPRAIVDVELKADVVEAAVAAIREARGDPPDRIVVSSFDPAILERLAIAAPAWRRWLNTDDLGRRTVDRAVALGVSGLSVRWRAIDGPGMAMARDAGLEVAAWTVRRISTARRLADLGVVALCVEGPALPPI